MCQRLDEEEENKKKPEEQQQDPTNCSNTNTKKKRKRKEVAIFGNYRNYYGYRVSCCYPFFSFLFAYICETENLHGVLNRIIWACLGTGAEILWGMILMVRSFFYCSYM